jgi:hypothetical protein
MISDITSKSHVDEYSLKPKPYYLINTTWKIQMEKWDQKADGKNWLTIHIFIFLDSLLVKD